MTALVSEPPFIQGKMIMTSKSKILQASENENDHVKAAIIAYNDDIVVKQKNVYATTNMVELELKGLPNNIKIMSLYLQPSSDIRKDLKEVMKIYESKYPTILAGDFNARSTRWNIIIFS